MNARAILVILIACGCSNRIPEPFVPLDAEQTAQVYDATLTDLKRTLTPRPGTTPAVNWSERMYLNPLVMLPAADSATPLPHDSAWLRSSVSRGLVQGVCGKPPATACPSDVPIAFTSLSAPWTRNGDTSYVQGGYAGEVPGATTYDAVFWIFTLARDEQGELQVIRKGPPQTVIFESR
jgi:hypothetical protein